MKQDLKKRIEEFNRIGYKDNSNRIIVATLKPASVTIAPNSTK